MKSWTTASDDVAQALRRAVEMDAPLVEKGDAIRGVKGRFHVVRDDHGSHPQTLLQATNQVVDGVGGDRIEAGRRLVVEDALGPPDDGPGEADAFAHAAAELLRHFFLLPRQIHHFERLGDACGDFLFVAQPASRRGKAMFSSTFIESKRAPLWKSMPIFLRTAPRRALGQRRDVLALDQHLAASGFEKADEVFQKHALSPTRAADDDARFALRSSRE